MKKGFTLVELLAVIVILSVIAIVTVPIIGNVIEESRKKALEESAYGIIEVANYLALKSNELEHFTFTSDGVESITENKLDYKGKVDAVGDLYIDEEGDISLCLYNDKYYVYKSYKMNDKVVIEEKKDNQTCIIGKDLLTNKYLAYAAEEGSSVNDSYYTKEDVDDLIERKVQEKVNEILAKFEDYAATEYITEYVDDQTNLLSSKIGVETLVTTSQTINGAINEVSADLQKVKSHVGMIVESTTLDTEEKVKAIYGGTTWTKIEGKFLLGQSSSYSVNSTGGTTSHSHSQNSTGGPSTNTSGSTAITKEQLPKNFATFNPLFWGSNTVSTGIASVRNDYVDRNGATGSDYGSATVTLSGGGQGHTHTLSNHTHTNPDTNAASNMPPYKVVYIWERTA